MKKLFLFKILFIALLAIMSITLLFSLICEPVPVFSATTANKWGQSFTDASGRSVCMCHPNITQCFPCYEIPIQ